RPLAVVAVRRVPCVVDPWLLNCHRGVAYEAQAAARGLSGRGAYRRIAGCLRSFWFLPLAKTRLDDAGRIGRCTAPLAHRGPVAFVCRAQGSARRHGSILLPCAGTTTQPDPSALNRSIPR